MQPCNRICYYKIY